jgi:hypothetical protein
MISPLQIGIFYWLSQIPRNDGLRKGQGSPYIRESLRLLGVFGMVGLVLTDVRIDEPSITGISNVFFLKL